MAGDTVALDMMEETSRLSCGTWIRRRSGLPTDVTRVGRTPVQGTGTTSGRTKGMPTSFRNGTTSTSASVTCCPITGTRLIGRLTSSSENSFRGSAGAESSKATPSDATSRRSSFPSAGPLARPGRGRVLLAGDAGGFVNGFTAEGIYYAMVSGELAASRHSRGRGQPSADGGQRIGARAITKLAASFATRC